MKILSIMAALILLLIIPAVGEIVDLGNYTIEFNLSKPHEIEEAPDGLLKIKTFDGVIFLTNEFFLEEEGYGESIIVDGQYGTLNFPKSGGDAYVVNLKNFTIASELPFYETADFLRGLHIKDNATSGGIPRSIS